MFQLNSVALLIGAARAVYKVVMCQMNNVDTLEMRIQIDKGSFPKGTVLVISIRKSPIL